jgi:Cu/Ag efflux pump CusA
VISAPSPGTSRRRCEPFASIPDHPEVLGEYAARAESQRRLLALGAVSMLGILLGGFVTVLGIAARNGIMLVSHYRHLEHEEQTPFGRELVLRGAEERLAPILMTALVTSLALVPIVMGGDRSGHEIEHPMAVVILGGLVTSTLLNVFLLPAIYLRFGRTR